jgi:hypothetical protein
MSIDGELQALVDAQILEQGAFVPMEFLLESGRLFQGDYERWRRGEIDVLDDVLMGSREKIRTQLESAATYARRIGLIEQPQIFQAWASTERSRPQDERSLRPSVDAVLHKLLGSRFVPAQDAPQLDLFFDNPVVALINGIVQALSARNLAQARRQLDGLYDHAPNHADLGAFDRLLAVLGHLDHPVVDERDELAFLLDITPVARRILGWEARQLLNPLWRRLADVLGERAFSVGEPELHRSFALVQSQDWSGVVAAVHREPQWWLHPPLCLRLAQSSFHQQRRSDALIAWFHLCWVAPAEAAAALDDPRLPDIAIGVSWRRFVESEDELWPDGIPEGLALDPADFPAWLLLCEPGLNLQIPGDLPKGNTPAEAAFRSVHRWIDARRENRAADELALRKAIQAEHPALFQCLKRQV